MCTTETREVMPPAGEAPSPQCTGKPGMHALYTWIASQLNITAAAMICTSECSQCTAFDKHKRRKHVQDSKHAVIYIFKGSSILNTHKCWLALGHISSLRPRMWREVSGFWSGLKEDACDQDASAESILKVISRSTPWRSGTAKYLGQKNNLSLAGGGGASDQFSQKSQTWNLSSLGLPMLRITTIPTHAALSGIESSHLVGTVDTFGEEVRN